MYKNLNNFFKIIDFLKPDSGENRLFADSSKVIILSQMNKRCQSEFLVCCTEFSKLQNELSTVKIGVVPNFDFLPNTLLYSTYKSNKQFSYWHAQLSSHELRFATARNWALSLENELKIKKKKKKEFFISDKGS